MKVSNLILDLASGDASIKDAYIEEALGKINVTSDAIKALDLIIESYLYNESDVIDEVVQEAAKKAGLPTKLEEASDAKQDALVAEMLGFYDLIIATAKKNRESLTKTLGVITGMGKKYGISSLSYDSGNYVSVFAEPLAKAIIENEGARQVNEKSLRNTGVGLVIGAPFATNRMSKKEYWTKGFITLDKPIFLKGDQAMNFARDYAKGVTSFFAAFGIPLRDIYQDKTIQKYIGIDDHSLSGKLISDVCAFFRIDPQAKSDRVTHFTPKEYGNTLQSLEHLLRDGKKSLNYERVLSSEYNFKDKIDAEELVEFFVAVYSILNVSETIINTDEKVPKRDMERRISTLLDYASEHRKTIISEHIRYGSDALISTCKKIVKNFSDSSYELALLVDKR